MKYSVLLIVFVFIPGCDNYAEDIKEGILLREKRKGNMITEFKIENRVENKKSIKVIYSTGNDNAITRDSIFFSKTGDGLINKVHF